MNIPSQDLSHHAYLVLDICDNVHTNCSWTYSFYSSSILWWIWN